jgi:hypothetical protein
MTHRFFTSGVLVVVLCVALCAPARANTSLKTAATEIVVGIVVVATAATVLVVVLIHKSKKTAITGCVSSGEIGLTMTDEKDQKIYSLSGNTTALKPGDRMTLKGKRTKAKGSSKTFVWETKAVTNDFGVCPR